jgi:predicted permease
VLDILKPFFMLGLLIALGAYVYASNLLDLDFFRKLSRLVVRFTFPAMLFVSMYNMEPGALQQGWIFTAVGLGTSVLLAFTAHYSGELFGLKGTTFGTYQILCTNGNNIFLPVPIIAALFGSPYVVYAVLFELGAGLFYWSYGVSHFRPGRRLSLRRLVNPNMLALVAGLILGLLPVQVPGSIYGALEILGNITLGSAMLIVGALVMNVLKRPLRPRREISGVVLHRLLLSPLVGVILLRLVPFPAELGKILLLLMAMPPLMTTALVAASFNADEELAAMGVALPTLLSFVVLPLALSML